MKCNSRRLEKDFAELKQYGQLENGGCTRLAFSREDLAARAWLQRKMTEAGLEVSIDAFGNMRGRRIGIDELPPVVIGSHLDTVPEGGNYDGTVGVLAGLEVVRTLNEHNLKTKRPIDVINFSAEESSRFGVSTMGSKVLVNNIDLSSLKEIVDKDGISLNDALKEGGFEFEKIESASIDPGQIHAFLEMHVEQGPVLEERKCPIGIVTTVAAPSRFEVCIEGRADHSGNTPMDMRKDALAAASELVLAVERITSTEAGENTVGTVGSLRVTPGAMNVVPGRVELSIDIRDINTADKDLAVQAIVAKMDEIAGRRELQINYKQLCHESPVTLSRKIINSLKDSAERANIPFILMPSGAGHDAMNMAQITDAGMIFIPSVGGISHNIAEFSRMEDISQGTNLLLQAVFHLAQE